MFRVINNPLSIAEFSGTYKFAAAGHDIGTLTNDAPAAVVGRVGAPPATVPVKIFAKDLDTGARQTVGIDVADESGVDVPTGGSILSFVGPLAVTQAAGTVLGGSPARLTGRACFAITFASAGRPPASATATCPTPRTRRARGTSSRGRRARTCSPHSG